MKLIKNLVIILLLLMGGDELYAEQNALNDQDMRLFEEIKQEHGLEKAQAYQLLGRAFLNNGFTEKASTCFKRAVELDESLFLSWYHLGIMNMDNPEYYFKKAIEANSEFPTSYYWLGMHYERCSKKTESMECFKKYLELVNRDDPMEEDRIKTAGKIVEGGVDDE